MTLSGDDEDGTGMLTILLGQTCSGYDAGAVATSLMYLLADCALQAGVPKRILLAEVYETLGDFYDSLSGGSQQRSN